MSPNARWSNGSVITAYEVKASFDRAKKVHGEDLKSLFDMVGQIQCPNDRTVEFHLVRDHLGLLLLKKLTEPMLGVLKVKPDGSLDLSVSSGAFVLEKTSPQETVLHKNTYWPYGTPAMADRIVLRASGLLSDPIKIVSDDKWPNLIISQSVMKESALSKIRTSGFTIWERNIDRVMVLTFLNGKLANDTGFQLFRFLQKALDRNQVQSEFGGLHLTDQIFSPGYPLYLDKLNCPVSEASLPSPLKGQRLKILIVPERVPSELRDNFSRAIQAATDTKPEFIEVPLNQLATEKLKKEHDFYLGSYGVGDPNYEGALSYFFELKPPPVASGQGNNNFAVRTAALRSEKDESTRLLASRGIVRDAICSGSIVPLFHFSTAVIASPEIDLTKIPTTDETVSFRKIRFLRKP